jgi:hypothetical protein
LILLIIWKNDVSGQKLRKAIFFFDGDEINFSQYKRVIKAQKFEEINTIPGTEETVEIFGDKAKNGVVHFKTTKFIQQQDSALLNLKNEFRNKGIKTKTIVLNGVRFERNEAIENAILGLENKDIEWLFEAAKTDNIFHTIGQIKVIQTNKSVIVPSR